MSLTPVPQNITPVKQTKQKSWSARVPVWIGMFGVFALVGVLGVWGNYATISGAVISSGMIQVESFRQVVQHPEGGVVGKINIEDGDIVDAGAVLIRLDDTFIQSERAIVFEQLNEIRARQARLIAERDAADDVTYDEELLDIAENNEKVADFLEGQSRLYQARKENLNKEIERLGERKGQIGLQVQGAHAQLEALELQLSFIEEELEDQQNLLEKGLTPVSRVLALQREDARLQGSVGELQATIAGGAAQIVETDLQILQLQNQRVEESITTLRDLSYSEIELSERLISLDETLSRMDIRAPMSGVVHGLTVHALRSVVQAAEPVLYIVPTDSALIISSRVEATHVDQVSVGQEAALRFTTFDQRTTPEIFGKVTKVSADVFEDETTGISYYSAEILPNEGELERLGEVELLPGMPVEAFIKTADRTPLSYLVKPFTDYFNRAFRET